MLTFAIVNLPSSSLASSSRVGAIALHGPHHGAQQTTRTGVVEALMEDLKESVVRLAIFSDMLISGSETKEWKTTETQLPRHHRCPRSTTAQGRGEGRGSGAGDEGAEMWAIHRGSF